MESILTQDIESKTKKAIQTLIKSGQLKDQNDPRAEQVKTIIKRNNSIDINGKTKLNQLLKSNEKYTKREQNKNINLDSIKEFSQKKQYPKGVVIYRVQQSKQGMNAVRKIVDMQWGYDANPWCLITRPMNKAWQFWKGYMGYPKHIVFQDGKLLAFCAGQDPEKNEWWNRKDKPSTRIKLLDGTFLKLKEKYKWTPEQEKKLFFQTYGLKLNPQTGRYDSDGSIYFSNKYLVNGHFPVKFGVINGDFYCIGCTELKSLDGAPTEVKGKIDYSGCINLPNYVEWETQNFLKKNKLILNKQTNRYDSDGNIYIDSCDFQTSDIPIKFGIINGSFSVGRGCKSLEGFMPTLIKSDLHLGYGEFTSLKGCQNTVVEGDFTIGDCHQLISLQNGPKLVKGNFKAIGLRGLKYLNNFYEKVQGKFEVINCMNLIPEDQEKAISIYLGLTYNEQTQRYDKDGDLRLWPAQFDYGKLLIPLGVINGNLEAVDVWRLKTLENFPLQIKGDCNISRNEDLPSLEGLGKVRGKLDCSRCDKLKITEQDRKKYKIKY